MLSNSPSTSSSSPLPASKAKTFFLVQALRALAAISVVTFHGTLEMRRVVDASFPLFDIGASGVDMFFVISGFVMTLSSSSLLVKPGGSGIFMRRRLERIVPLYWIVTSVQVAVTYFAPGLQEPNAGGAWRVIKSFLFIPVNGFPVVAQGWTLNYEMLFYVLFAISITLRIKPLRFVAPTLIILILFYRSFSSRDSSLASFCDPVMLEFVFGMVLAAVVRESPSLRSRKLWIKVVLALVVYAATFHVHLLHRPYARGVPSLIVVGLAVVLERKIGPKTPRFILALGDASYSIYLAHVLVMAFLFPLLIRGPYKGSTAETVFIAAYVVVATGVGLCLHRFVEQPIMAYFQRQRPITA